MTYCLWRTDRGLRTGHELPGAGEHRRQVHALAGRQAVSSATGRRGVDRFTRRPSVYEMIKLCILYVTEKYPANFNMILAAEVNPRPKTTCMLARLASMLQP